MATSRIEKFLMVGTGVALLGAAGLFVSGNKVQLAELDEYPRSVGAGASTVRATAVEAAEHSQHAKREETEKPAVAVTR